MFKAKPALRVVKIQSLKRVKDMVGVIEEEAKRASKHPETFGEGEIDGLVASESSNNAVTGGALIPLPLAYGYFGEYLFAAILGV